MAAAAPPPVAPRRLGRAATEALPDVLAALACATAWIAPQALGFDLLRLAAPLYFVELPLAILTSFAGVRRMQRGALSRGEKLRVVLAPAAVLLLASALLLGASGALAVLWLGALTLGRVLLERPDAAPAVRGAWLSYDRRERLFALETVRPSPRPGLVVVPAGHEQLMAAVTVGTWVMIPIALAILPPLGEGGATAAYAASVGWSDTLPGRWVPAHAALAAGLILFAVRAFGHFEGLDEPPPERVEDDAVLREVIETVEKRRRR